MNKPKNPKIDLCNRVSILLSETFTLEELLQINEYWDEFIIYDVSKKAIALYEYHHNKPEVIENDDINEDDTDK